MEPLRSALIDAARSIMPKPGGAALNKRQRDRLHEAVEHLEAAHRENDPLLVAENLRRTRRAFDSLVGRTSTEDVLDALFGRFCIGK